MAEPPEPGALMLAEHDPRLTPVLGDIAAAHLKGVVEAKHFVEGQRMQVATSHAGLRAAPSSDAEQVNQSLFGETITVYHRKDGWAWGQLDGDGYVGWMALVLGLGLSAAANAPIEATKFGLFRM